MQINTITLEKLRQRFDEGHRIYIESKVLVESNPVISMRHAMLVASMDESGALTTSLKDGNMYYSFSESYVAVDRKEWLQIVN